MVTVTWSDFAGAQPDYFNPYGLTYPVAPQSTWAEGGSAAWPAGSGEGIGQLYVVGSDDLSGYDPSKDRLIFGFRDGSDVTEMNAHNYCVLWEEQANGLLTLNVMPVSIWESTSPIATISDLDPADLSTIIQSWAATNNHFQDDLMASVYSLDPNGGWPENHIAIQTHIAGEVTTYDFDALKAEFGDSLVLNFVVMTGRELYMTYDAASETLTISHYGEGWGGYNDVWGKTVIVGATPQELVDLEQLWRYDATFEDGRLLHDRFNEELEDLVAASDNTTETPEDLPDVTVDNFRVEEGEESVLRFQVKLSKASDEVVSVHYTTQSSSATAGEDFVEKSGTITFQPGQTSKIVTVDVVNDLVEEGEERLLLKLSNASGANLADDGALGWIEDDDAYDPNLPDVSVSNRRADEGASLTFRMDLSAPATEDVTLYYRTSDSTAVAGSDYEAVEGKVVIAAGETSAKVTVDLVDDGLPEDEERFLFEIVDADGANIADGKAAGWIEDDDAAASLPDVSVDNRRTEEGEGASLTFRFDLSEAAEHDVTISYATKDSTAKAGSDYVAVEGSVVIPAGETEAKVTVDLLNDQVSEGEERFIFEITEASGANVADGKAAGWIDDDDSGSVPGFQVSSPTVDEGDAATGGGGTGLIADGPLSTSGNQILDSAGNAVEIRAVNWFGFETNTQAPHGLWTRNWQEMLEEIRDTGFNAIRLPFSTELVLDGGTPNGIDFGLNPDLQGLSGLQIMDKMVDYADSLGLKIILDNHRSEAGDGPNGSGLWYDGVYDEDDLIDAWTTLAARYAGKDSVIAADLANEPHNGTWGDDSATDWAAAAERIGNAIQAVNSDWLIVVEGVGSYQGDSYWWGGNLQGVADRPVELDVDNKLVYSPHDYPASVYAQSWFYDGSDLTEVFREHWGYIYEEGIAPILLGEFGSRLETEVDRDWAEAITAYLNGDLNNDGTIDTAAGQSGMSWSWWSWNPNSGDTGGVLEDDWTTVRQDVVTLLEPLMAEEGGSAAVSNPTVEFEVTLDAAADEELVFQYHTSDDTAEAGEDYVATSGQLVFAAGETSKTVQVELLPDDIAEEDETFRLVVTGPDDSRVVGRATILDDDSGGASGGGGGGTETPPSSDEDFELAFTLDNDWGSGAQWTATLTNLTDGASDAWALEFDLPFEIEQIWNGEIASHSGERYRVDEADWNGEVQAGASVSFGFIASDGGYTAATLLAEADAEAFFT